MSLTKLPSHPNPPIKNNTKEKKRSFFFGGDILNTFLQPFGSVADNNKLSSFDKVHMAGHSEI